MKYLKSAVLSILLSLVLACSPAPAQAPAATPSSSGYNLSGCRQRGFGVYHVDIASGKMVFTWHLAEPGVIEKYAPADALTLDYTEEPVDKDGDISWRATGKSKDGKRVIEVNGWIRGKAIIGIGLLDGDLSMAFYGKEGSADDIAKEHSSEESDEDYKFCVSLQPHTAAEISIELAQWLLNQNTQNKQNKQNSQDKQIKGGEGASR